MTPNEAVNKVKQKLKELEDFRNNDLPHIIGTEAVNHYNESFVLEGATDENLQKWQDVKRRNPNSPWYGFSLGASSLRPGQKNKRKSSNYSPSRAKDKILTGETNELKNATDYSVKSDRVTVHNDKPYAKVHNFGGTAKVFGKKPFVMPARPFIYPSRELNSSIRNKVMKEIDKIKKS